MNKIDKRIKKMLKGTGCSSVIEWAYKSTIAGFKMLGRPGVSFTEEQKRKIKEIMEERKMKVLKLVVIVFIALIIVSSFVVTWVFADPVYKEVDYQEYFAEWIGGETEILLGDRSRVDILTEDYAIEIDYSYKWAEGIGQALFYAEKTGRQPGVVLILARRKTYENYISRILVVAVKYGIIVWSISEDFKIARCGNLE